MSEEQKTEIFQVEKNAVEKSDTSGKSNGKKWGIIGGVALILIALIVGIRIYNSPKNRLSRQLDLGNRYLEEQNYEQAIVEFDKAVAIDPMNVDAYLGKAQAYEGMSDLENALETLWTGYDQTGDEQIREVASGCLKSYIEQLIAEERYDETEALIEKYRDKVLGVDFQKYLDEIDELKAEVELEELLANVPSFGIADIKVMGYDLLEPRLEEIIGALGYSGIPHGDTELQNGVYEGVSRNGVDLSQKFNYENGSDYWLSAWWYLEYDGECNLCIQKVNGQETNASQIGMSRSNMPLTLGDSYEKWCDLLGVDLLRKSSFTKEEESSSFDEFFNVNSSKRTYIISVGDTFIEYRESTYETDVRFGNDGHQDYEFYFDMYAIFSMDVEEENVDSFDVHVFFLDGTLQRIDYDFVWRS